MADSDFFANIALTGSWENAGDALYALLDTGFRLQHQPRPLMMSESAKILYFAALADSSDVLERQFTWLAWARTNDPALILKAYQAGARAVFPAEMPPTLMARRSCKSLKIRHRQMVLHNGAISIMI